MAYRGVTTQCSGVQRAGGNVQNPAVEAPPSSEQAKNIDYMLAAGELFTLIVYAQLILENSKLCAVDDLFWSRSLFSWSKIFPHLHFR